MLIPLADVPRWYADRKPKDTIASGAKCREGPFASRRAAAKRRII
jgi:hypothetical protein